MFIGRMAAGPHVRSCPMALRRGLKVRPYPPEREPSVSRADGGNEGRGRQPRWRDSYYRLHWVAELSTGARWLWWWGVLLVGVG
jgi:hypothetical protein